MTDWPTDVRVEVAFGVDPGDVPATADWVDVSEWVRDFRCARGRDHELDRVTTGTATLTLNNNDRRFDPTWEAGPYWPDVIPARRVRIVADLDLWHDDWDTLWTDVSFPIFEGFVRGWQLVRPDRANTGEDVTVELYDGMRLMQLADASGSRPVESSGARVDWLLDEAGWPSSKRTVDVGQSEVQAKDYDGMGVLAGIQEVSETESGLFFIDGAGDAVFHDRHHRLLVEDESAHTFEAKYDRDEGRLPYTNLTPSFDESQLWNRVRVEPAGLAAQTADDAASQLRFGRRALSISTLGVSELEAADQSQWHLARYAEPDLRFDSIDLSPRSDALLWHVVLGAEMGRRVTVISHPPGGGLIERDAHIERITHSASSRQWSTTFGLSPGLRDAFWVLDSDENSVLNSTTRLAY